MKPYNICIVEDDQKVAELLQTQLVRFGYEATVIGNLEGIDAEVLACKPHLVLLDINLPYYDGFYWCRRIRQHSKVPIVYISARSGEMDLVLALESGGDDYLTKPFHPEVMMAKLRALLRRTYGEYAEAPTNEDEVEVQGLVLDVHRHTVRSASTSGEIVLSLSATEAGLLRRLMEAQGKIVSRDDLLGALWDDTQFVDDNTLTVNIARVRRKLEELGLPTAIVTVRGQGYRLEVEAGV
ncbi:response regulator transcription factor [Tumebacillus sp. ITR2]|uniref:Response regulator transcription factor n=1 Tax=Tumebacillus amylolyticus TaxID=2801339 RepID=A0ABS1JFD3_9BACL|nr:response regulator transcription factor [Tumebacillus amylolyticus]MBL0388714.1 response regulator transcription factor [Tumebacillus amylolyticus]